MGQNGLIMSRVKFPSWRLKNYQFCPIKPKLQIQKLIYTSINDLWNLKIGFSPKLLVQNGQIFFWFRMIFHDLSFAIIKTQKLPIDSILMIYKSINDLWELKIGFSPQLLVQNGQIFFCFRIIFHQLSIAIGLHPPPLPPFLLLAQWIIQFKWNEFRFVRKCKVMTLHVIFTILIELLLTHVFIHFPPPPFMYIYMYICNNEIHDHSSVSSRFSFPTCDLNYSIITYKKKYTRQKNKMADYLIVL